MIKCVARKLHTSVRSSSEVCSAACRKMRSLSLMSAFHLDQENAIAELTSAICRYNRYSAAAFYHSAVQRRRITTDGVSRHVSCFETVLRHCFSWISLGSVSTLVCLVLALSQLSMSRHVSCLMTVSWLCLCQAQLSAYSVLKHWHFLLKVGC